MATVDAAEHEKIKEQLLRAMKGFNMMKEQLGAKAKEAETAKAEASQLREERDSGLPRRWHTLDTATRITVA